MKWRRVQGAGVDKQGISPQFIVYEAKGAHLWWEYPLERQTKFVLLINDSTKVFTKYL